jgi:hypothetical protein
MAANKGQQGTGRHSHKSTDAPWPHTKEEGTQSGKSQGGSRRDDNRSHAGGSSHGRSHDSGRDNDNHSRGGSHQTQSRTQDHDREQEADLKRREYRGDDGQIHHHTRTYMEQHGDDDTRGGDNRSHDREHASASSDSRSHGRDDNRSHGSKR